MPKKERIPIPQDIAADVLVRSHRTCCKCNEPGRPIQIHHIDENPSNNIPDNLAVLCLDCHEETQLKGGFGRKLDRAQVLLYRDNWYQRVQNRRNEADKISATRLALPEKVSKAEPETREIIPDPARLLNFIRTLPAVKDSAYQHAQPLWDSGQTSDQRQGCYDVNDVLEQILITLTSWCPSNHFGGCKPNDYIDEIMTARYVWHRRHMEPLGGGTGGTIVGLMVADSVMSDLERMIAEVVSSLSQELSEFDFPAWIRRWEGTSSSSRGGEDLGQPQRDILNCLFNQTEFSPEALSRNTGIEVGMISYYIDELKTKGYVECSRAEVITGRRWHDRPETFKITEMGRHRIVTLRGEK